ncbi:TPA: hypothetical protein RQJ73_001459 [Vibrio vulnificus]|nr:hypothetical protein [Vibrio vulnificus]HAS6370504.1 hypothetical protein [Vibrio vulnificus]HDY7628207.1 hypothetical protein [Vibrio vulnificus]HDY7723445.1 hypothetical protein [Vibrio vulnificus]HDY7732646.1 hypothetical protein [Vibrio vulnificus]
MKIKSTRHRSNTVKGKISSKIDMIGNNVSPISVEQMIIDAGIKNQKCYFKRLSYYKCPSIRSGGSGDKSLKGSGELSGELIHMNRDEFVRDSYNLFRTAIDEKEISAQTARAYFYELTYYVTTLDELGVEVSFSLSTMKLYMSHRKGLTRRGAIKKGTLNRSRTFLIFVLHSLSRDADIKELEVVKGVSRSKKKTEVLSDEDHSDYYRLLLTAYKKYLPHLSTEIQPEYCYIYNESIVKNMEADDGKPFHDENSISKHRANSIRRIKSSHDYRNIVSKIALAIIARTTGINASPLILLKKKHVKVKKITANKYAFDLKPFKGRVNFEQQVFTTGFSKRDKEFIESWLQVSSMIDNSAESYLFPYITETGSMDHLPLTSLKDINRALAPYDLETVTFRNLRATRSSKVYRATGSVLHAAQANRNSVQTTAFSYTNAPEEVVQLELAGALIVREKTMHGEDKASVINEVKNTFKDPLSDYEYQQKIGRKASKTTIGVRCSNPFDPEKVAKSMRKLSSIGTVTDDEPQSCLDFLECFECDNHVLISEVDDIHLMLSFKDAIYLTLTRPSYNSAPPKELESLLIKVSAALSLLEDSSPDNYLEAVERNNHEPHPLYNDEFSISDITRVY